ncbi:MULTISPECIES: helix-turn-helix domain-containing protein [Streptomyces]|uniref:Helix-turn-helix domain-containing protein n=1 Tax=Streptomyces edwardsiae TaxID=3075527 RepID=A0ABU2QH97_9ACTN|nr:MULTISPECIES: helix-turn-helix domain-containing protein [unclassified Streptomyces]MDT0393869.1 helix-turn-helix domain-containing protein [Streptomyces sp. DSM 41636]MDT0402845.1 helix-turn-helix domain-containing protein [Streptomyces sp. DSM 41635]
MPSSARPPVLGEPLDPLPRQFAAFMRPQLPGLLNEIRTEVTRTYPVYGRLLNGPDGDAIRQGVEQALTAFVDRVADPASSSELRDELLRRFGRVEAYEGRDLEVLQGAYRLGARIALRRARTVGRQHSLSPALILAFADALFAYVEELESVTREGYAEVRERAASEESALRRQLLHSLLSSSPPPRTTVSELCKTAAWELPRSCFLVALRPPASEHILAGLDRDVLADLDIPQPHLLVPGDLTPQRLDMLRTALTGTRAAIGLTVPLNQAADSVRWARRVLQLADDDVIADAPLIRCEDHLTTLWLLSDNALVDRVAARELAALDELPARRRDRLVETLRVHVSTRAPAEQVGEILGVHAQTVRYRLRMLDTYLGDRLADPEHRFAIEVALRSLHLRGHDSPE